ncbi:MAG: DUF4179 domain-containing protein [Lysinibacillus sp.]
MKKVYKQFNHLKIETELEPMEVNELEMARIKQRVLKKRKRKQLPKIAGSAAAILLAVNITAGIAFPAYAEKIPFLSNVFQLFNDESNYVFEGYEEFATDIGVTKESNGISITVTDAVYDGENVTIAYTMASEKELGTRPGLEGPFIIEELKKRYEHGGYSTRHLAQKVNEHEYAGLFVYQLVQGSKPEEIHASWNGDAVIDFNHGSTAYEGDWDFQFHLKKLEGKTTKLADTGLLLREDGIEINMSKMVSTPVSTTLYITERVLHDQFQPPTEDWHGIDVEYKVVDNLGNKYQTIVDHGVGVQRELNNLSQTRLMMNVIHKDATSLTVTPYVSVLKLGMPRATANGSSAPLEVVGEPYMIGPIEVPMSE